MKTWKLIYAVVAALWAIPFLALTYFGIILYACYLSIRWKDPEIIEHACKGAFQGLDLAYGAMKTFVVEG